MTWKRGSILLFINGADCWSCNSVWDTFLAHFGPLITNWPSFTCHSLSDYWCWPCPSHPAVKYSLFSIFIRVTFLLIVPFTFAGSPQTVDGVSTKLFTDLYNHSEGPQGLGFTPSCTPSKKKWSSISVAAPTSGVHGTMLSLLSGRGTQTHSGTPAFS